MPAVWHGMKPHDPRNRFKNLIRKQPGGRSLFNRLWWIATTLLCLQFLIPEALNSYEEHWKPEEMCGSCLRPGSIHFCPYGPTNRICPGCGREWNAAPYRIWSEPWIILAVKMLFRWT